MSDIIQQYQIDFPHLFSPLEIKGKVIKNRTFSAPMALALALDENEFLTERGMHVFGDMAKGGTGVITLGEGKLDDLNSKAHDTHFECRDPKVLMPYHFYTEYVHSFGALASIEFNHNGQFSMPQFNPQHLGPMGASEMIMPNGLKVKEMNEDDMREVAESYAQAALIARRSGFDMILLHFAHGWLMGGFLSPLINHRKDKYGGSHENRMRFPLQVIKRIREVAGDGLLIEVRLSGDEYSEGGIKIEDAVEYAKLLDDSGMVDLIHMSAGTRFDGNTRAIMHPSHFIAHGHNAKFAEAVKKAGVKIPVGIVGAVTDPFKAEEILTSGQADYVVMARQLMCDPEWVNKAKHGRAGDIRQCMRCLHCFDTHRVNTGTAVLDDWKATLVMKCDINPTFGHRALIGEIPVPAVKKKVAVIGGGPAGMQAALEAANRGHEVDLYERTGKLGGLLNIFADPVWFKEGETNYREYMIRQIEQSSVKVHLNTNATKESVFAIHPDAVIVAIGGKIYQPEFEGAKEIASRNVLGIYNNEEALGEKVVIIGAGPSGCEAALHLTHLGKTVTVLTPEEIIMPEEHFSTRNHTIQYMDQDEKLSYFTKRTVKRFTKEGVVVENEQGEEEIYPADTVVYATGMQPRKEDADDFVGTAVDVIKVGDCRQIGTIGTAVHDGYDAAASLLY